jgi:hypothetical protein
MSMVRFMVKWAVAAIPAMAILALVGVGLSALMFSLWAIIATAWRQHAAAASEREAFARIVAASKVTTTSSSASAQPPPAAEVVGTRPDDWQPPAAGAVGATTQAPAPPVVSAAVEIPPQPAPVNRPRIVVKAAAFGVRGDSSPPPESPAAVDHSLDLDRMRREAERSDLVFGDDERHEYHEARCASATSGMPLMTRQVAHNSGYAAAKDCSREP